ncbi:MAG: hypothetical protein LUG66_04375 [Clostridiales bacterium]|nr:hypothetical protein [Clostridiales bacterium]
MGSIEKLCSEDLDDWRNADDKTLADAFDTMFTPSKKDMDNLNKAGFENKFETIYINGVLMKDYYAQNPLEEGKDKKADIMRKFLNREAQIDVLRYDDDLKPVVSTVTAESRFPAKTVTTGRVFKKTVTIDENKMFKDFSENEASNAARRKAIANKAVDAIPPERLVRLSKKNVAEALEQRSKENMRLVENEIRQQFKLGEGAVDPVEYQLYMLSQGMSMKDILDVNKEKELKKDLCQQWYSLKISDDPEDKNVLNEELAKMKKTLAGAALHGGDLSDSDNILGNLEQITWLNRAAEVFTAENGLGKDLGSEYDNKTIQKISNITKAQLGLAEYIKSDDYVLDRPFDVNTHKEAMLNKLYLEGCNAEISGRMYSLVNDAEPSKVYDKELEYDEHQVERNGIAITAWLEGKGGRNIHLDVDKEGPALRVTDELSDPKKVNIKGEPVNPVPEIKAFEKLHNELTEGFNKDIGDELSVISENIDNEAQLAAKEIARLAPQDFLDVDIDDEAEKTVQSVFDKQGDGLKNVFNRFESGIDQYKEVVETKAKAEALKEADYENKALRGELSAFPEFTEKQEELIADRLVSAEKEKFEKQAEMTEQINKAVSEYSGNAAKIISEEPLFEKRKELYEMFDDDGWTLTKNLASAKVKDALIKVEAENDEISQIQSEADLDSYLNSHPSLKADYNANIKSGKNAVREYFKSEKKTIESMFKDAKNTFDDKADKKIIENDKKFILNDRQKKIKAFDFEIKKAALSSALQAEMNKQAENLKKDKYSTEKVITDAEMNVAKKWKLNANNPNVPKQEQPVKEEEKEPAKPFSSVGVSVKEVTNVIDLMYADQQLNSVYEQNKAILETDKRKYQNEERKAETDLKNKINDFLKCDFNSKKLKERAVSHEARSKFIEETLEAHPELKGLKKGKFKEIADFEKLRDTCRKDVNNLKAQLDDDESPILKSAEERASLLEKIAGEGRWIKTNAYTEKRDMYDFFGTVQKKAKEEMAKAQKLGQDGIEAAKNSILADFKSDVSYKGLFKNDFREDINLLNNRVNEIKKQVEYTDQRIQANEADLSEKKNQLKETGRILQEKAKENKPVKLRSLKDFASKSQSGAEKKQSEKTPFSPEKQADLENTGKDSRKKANSL